MCVTFVEEPGTKKTNWKNILCILYTWNLIVHDFDLDTKMQYGMCMEPGSISKYCDSPQSLGFDEFCRCHWLLDSLLSTR